MGKIGSSQEHLLRAPVRLTEGLFVEAAIWLVSVSTPHTGFLGVLGHAYGWKLAKGFNKPMPSVGMYNTCTTSALGVHCSRNLFLN